VLFPIPTGKEVYPVQIKDYENLIQLRNRKDTAITFGVFEL
jgi:hypothetical protein